MSAAIVYRLCGGGAVGLIVACGTPERATEPARDRAAAPAANLAVATGVEREVAGIVAITTYVVGASRDTDRAAAERRIGVRIHLKSDGSSSVALEPLAAQGGSGRAGSDPSVESPSRLAARTFDATLGAEARRQAQQFLARVAAPASAAAPRGRVSQSLVMDAEATRALRAHTTALGGNARLGGDSLRSVFILPDGNVYETRFDGATGFPIEENLFAKGRLRMQRTMTYQPLAGSDLFARVKQVTEFEHPADPRRHVVVEETFTPTTIR